MSNFITCSLTLLITISPMTIYGQMRILNVLYTGSLQGELEPCGCSPKTDFGGPARLSGYLAENKKDLQPYLLLDAGNFSGEDTPQGRLKTETVLGAFSIMRYDAVALLERESVFKDDFIQPLLQRNEIPAVSGAPKYNTSVSLNRANFDVNISADPGDLKEGKLNILLTDLPVSASKLFKGWDVIILSSGEILDEPLKVNGTVIVSGYPKGKNLGILTLKVDDSGNVVESVHRRQPLGSDIKEDASVRGILNDYDSRVAGLLKEAEKPLTETAYLGAVKCAECHRPFIESWKDTRHAGAFASLEKVGKAADPECIKCHVVGFGEEGGFYSIQTTPELANVQCEVCHGSGKGHLSALEKPLKPVSESVCLKCHTRDNSPDFDYSIYREKIEH
ncbi:MAG: hypothetical protein HZA14_00780 [Nitrospirae bacterium]|nr:hypothetical protein [Nitrospirota bacterium]